MCSIDITIINHSDVQHSHIEVHFMEWMFIFIFALHYNNRVINVSISKPFLKKFLTSVVFITTLGFATVTVDGYALLENQSDHSSITLTFQRTYPSALTETATTDTIGYFTAQLDTGIYNVTYTKDGYFSESLSDQSLYEDTTLTSLTLFEHTTLINVPSLFSTIQSAIDHAFNGDTILVAAGTYVEPNKPYFDNGSSAGPNLYEKDSLVILGEGSEMTIIDLDDHYYGFIFSYNSNDNIVDGFTIKNGGELLITALNNSYNNTFKNCVFLATGGESHTYASYFSGENFINCTFIGDGENNVLFNYPTQSVITNSIFYNYNGFISEDNLEELTISYSLFYEVSGALPTGETLKFQDPRFCYPDTNNYDLAENSPCVGTGSEGLNIGALDVGCDVIGSSFYVSKFGSDDNNGSEENPFLTIQAGFNAAWHTDTVYVASGTYLENIRWPEKPDISLIGEDKDSTIIDGNNTSIVIWIERLDEEFNSFGSILIKDFTIQNGYSTYVGGIYTFNNSASIELDDLNIVDNGGINGSGLYAYASDSVSLNNVLMENNKSYTQNSFAIYSRDCNLTINSTTITNNSKGIFVWNGGSTVTEVTSINNSILWGNYNGDGEMNTITFYDSYPLEADIDYSLLEGGIEGMTILSNTLTLDWGDNNIDSNPLFCEPDSGNYYLGYNSPCVGASGDGGHLGAFDVGCDNVYLPPEITAIPDTSMNEDSELYIYAEAESEQDYNIYFDAYSDTSSVYVYVLDNLLEIQLMTDWNGSTEITVLAYCEFDYNINNLVTFTLTVNSVDDLPYLDGHIYPLDYQEDFGVDTVAYLPDVFVDIDGELTFSYSFTDSTILTADVSSSHLVLSSINDISGDTELMVTATNPTRASVTDTVQISVWPVNDPPVIDSIPNIVMDEDTELFFDVSSYINDIDSDEIGVLVDNVSALMNDYVDVYMDGPDTLRLIAYDNWNGTGTITIIANDGELSDSEEINVIVNPVNDSPVFENLSALVNVGTEFHVPIQVYDIDLDSLVISFDDSWTYPDWLSLVYDPHSLAGTAPEPVDVHFPLNLSDGQATVTDTFHLSAAFFNPRVTSVTDVPDDQGGRVYVSFNASFFDVSNEPLQNYGIMRYDYFDNDSSGWVALSSFPAIGDPSYTFEATTVMDSTSEGDGMTEFKVVASMSEGIFHSDPDSGYSVDNIAPDIPGGFMATVLDEGIHLTWDISLEDDFQYFILEKSLNNEFQEYETFETIDTSYIDLEYVLNETNYYRLAAVDHAENVSEYSDVVEAAVLSIDGDLIPEVFALHQNYPNPFNPTTQIRYDLPEGTMGNITVYDMMGRQVKTLVNSLQTAGYKSVQWDATNDKNHPVSAGLYLYTIQAGEFNQTKKMILLK